MLNDNSAPSTKSTRSSTMINSNITFNELSSISIKKTNNDFSLIDTVANLAVNNEFIVGYQELLNNKETENVFLWRALSALGQDISETIYSNILNYINNVANIDTCTVKSLNSMAAILGTTSRGLSGIIQCAPPEILRLLDILSIPQSKLITTFAINTDLYLDLFQKTAAQTGFAEKFNKLKVSVLSTEIIQNELSVLATIPRKIYKDFVKQAFLNELSNNININYDGSILQYDDRVGLSARLSDDLFVCKTLILSSDTTQTADTAGETTRISNSDAFANGYLYAVKLNYRYADKLNLVKKRYNLDDFDADAILDDIEAGKDLFENYSGDKSYILSLVKKYRAEAFLASNLTTRYAYYQEKKVLDYLKFLNRMFMISSFDELETLLNDNYKTYDLDPNYIEIADNRSLWDGKADISKFVYHLNDGENIKDSKNNILIYPYKGYPKVEVIENVAAILTDIALAIADLRSTLKTQSQRNHMRGTFLLLSYVISEYLKKNLPTQYPILADTITNLSTLERSDIVNVVEYLDTTEYYNLSTESTPFALNSGKVNYPYWKAENDDFTGVGLAISDIDNFYLNTLNLKSAVSSTENFLNIIYELGADKSYVDKNLSDNIVVTEMFDGKDEEVIQDPTLSTKFNQISAYQEEIFLKYGGNDYAYKPYFNWKNITHSSYQIHPYLYRFVEYSNLAYSIKNAFASDANSQLLLALETSEISSCIGNCGNIINIWDRNCVDYSGYRSRYESNTHNQETNYGEITPLQHYDGTFYPSAVDEYIKLLGGTESARNYTLSTVAHRLTGRDIVNMLSVEGRSVEYIAKEKHELIKKLGNDNVKPYLSGYIASHIQLEDELEIANIKGISEEIINAKQALRDFEEVGPVPTFYEKWYSHLNLPHEDAIKIAIQLSAHYVTIKSLYQDDKRDIYKYGLDKYSNSYILYKKYLTLDNTYSLSDIPYKTKQNTRGELWFRYNSHPIGFPLLTNLGYSNSRISTIFTKLGFLSSDLVSNEALSVKLENLSQISLAGMNIALDTVLKTNDLSVFYDFDFTSDYRYMFLAYDEQHKYTPYSSNTSNLAGKDPSYSNASIMSLRPFEDQYDYNLQFENLIHLELQPYDLHASFNFADDGDVILPADDGDASDGAKVIAKYDFKGFYQDPETALVHALYIKRITNRENSKYLSFAKVEFPGEKIAYTSFKLYSDNVYISEGETVSNTTELNKLNVTNRLIIDEKTGADIQIGFCNNEYTLAFLTELPKEFDGRNYVGFNSFKTNLSTSTDLSSIYDNIYGQCDYINDPRKQRVDDTEEHNSFDRFDTFITVVSFNKSALTTIDNTIITKNYNLNSDASYIPLYASFNGQLRIWAADYYRKQKIHSIELLGMSFNALTDKITNFEYGIFTDTEGNLTLVDPIEYLSAEYRIFEQFDENKYFLSAANSLLRPRGSGNKYESPSWVIDFSSIKDLNDSKTTEEIANRYCIMFYNIARGPRFPILNCPLSVFNHQLSNGVLIGYDNIPTSADTYFKNNQYLEKYTSEIRGTTNIFENEDHFRVTSINTNYIFGISSITPVLFKNNNNIPTQLSLRFDIDSSYYSNTDESMPYPYIIDEETLGVFLYKDSLDEYDNYHYIYHHLDWPYNKVSNKDISTYLSSFPLSANSFDDPNIVLPRVDESGDVIYPIKDGSLAFKIAEEVESTNIKYPDGLTKGVIFELFGKLNKEYSTLSNVFSPENTFVFELNPPKEIAKLVGTVNMGIYSDGVDSIRVYEDYLSVMHSIGKNELDILPYLKFSTTNHYDNTDALEDVTTAAASKNETGFSNLSDYANMSLEEALANVAENLLADIISSNKADENSNIPNMTIDYTVTEEDIKDFLKLYVNYIVDKDGFIELFFNYNNLFDTPYSYRTADGHFAPVFKESTYLRLKPGESGFLDIVIQIKYFDAFGEVCGIKDIPALCYKIYNVSDDKPKFVIYNTWKLSPETVASVKDTSLEETTATLTIENTVIKPTNLSSYLNADFTTNRDLTCYCDIISHSDMTQVKALTCDLLIDYSDPFVMFNQSISKNAAFITRDGYIRAMCLSSEYNSAEFTVGFTLLKGAPIDPETGRYRIPIDAINFKAKNTADAYITKTYVIPGSITIDFGTITNRKYLAKETKDSNLFKGFILAENSELIRIFKGGEN